MKLDDTRKSAANSKKRQLLHKNRNTAPVATANNFSCGSDTGFIYSQSEIDTAFRGARTVTILLTACENIVAIDSAKASQTFSAALIKPNATHRRRANNIELITVVINPTHPAFRCFSTASGTVIRGLDRHMFADLNDSLHRFYLGKLSFEASMQLLENIVAITASQLPAPKPLDPRVMQLITSICVQPSRCLTDMAQDVRISSCRLTHLFSQEMGLSLRAFQAWYKLDLAWRLMTKGLSLTEVAMESGFADSAHFCKAIVLAHGVPISRIRKRVCGITKYVQERPSFSFEVAATIPSKAMFRR